MERDTLAALLRDVAGGGLSPEAALRRLAGFPVAELGFARLDMQRHARRGVPETVYGAGKTPEQVLAIARRMREADAPVLVTRVSPEAAERVRGEFPGAVHNEVARTLTIGSLARLRQGHGGRPVLIAAAGTSDLPVAEEAAVTAAFLGREVLRATDVGVAGLHRLASAGDELARAGVVVAVAGMEGALPGVIAGLVGVPVIGVPTSVGYGVSLGGMTPLFTMLSSCACGLTVVNIDNGYGAAVAAHLILAAGESTSHGGADPSAEAGGEGG
jgi:pyridinium-3,5-biscarboxylic acid mononucleotide synthase